MMTAWRSACAGRNERCWPESRPRSWSKRRFGIFVMHVDVLADGCFQFLHTSENATANTFVGNLGEPALHQIDPGTVGGREVDVKARSLGEPFPNDGRFMSAVVIQNDVSIKFGGYVRLEVVEKLAEFQRTMPAMQLADHTAGLQLQRGE